MKVILFLLVSNGISHIGIVRIIDIFYENDNLYIVEDYIEGKTFKEHVTFKIGDIEDIAKRFIDKELVKKRKGYEKIAFENLKIKLKPIFIILF